MNKLKTALKNMSDAKKSAMAYMIGSYIQYGISFLVTPIFARLLTTGEFGLVTTYNSWVEMIGPIATLSLYQGFYNIGMVDYENDRDAFTSSMLGLSFISTTVSMLVFGVVNSLFPEIVGLPISLVILMTIYYFTFPATRYWMAKERFEYKYKKLFVVTMLIAVLAPAGGLLYVYLYEGNLGIARLVGTNAIHIAIGVLFIVVLIKRNRSLKNVDLWKKALAFSLPLVPHYLAMQVLSASDRVMINAMTGESNAGIYGMAYTAAMVVTAAWTAINGSLTPYVLNKLKEKDYKSISRTSMLCIGGFSLICLLVCIVAPEVIQILGGAKYSESINLLPPLLAAVVFMEMYNLFSLVEFYHKKTKLIMIATLAAAVVNVVLNFICIRIFGYQAAAYTTLVCYILYCLFHYLNMRHIEKEKIYDAKLLVAFSAIYVILCFACLLIYDYPLLRYSILAVVILLVIIKRKTLMGFYKKLSNKE